MVFTFGISRDASEEEYKDKLRNDMKYLRYNTVQEITRDQREEHNKFFEEHGYGASESEFQDWMKTLLKEKEKWDSIPEELLEMFIELEGKKRTLALMLKEQREARDAANKVKEMNTVWPITKVEELDGRGKAFKAAFKKSISDYLKDPFYLGMYGVGGAVGGSMVSLLAGNEEIAPIAIGAGAGLFVGFATSIFIDVQYWMDLIRNNPMHIKTLKDAGIWDLLYDTFVLSEKLDEAMAEKSDTLTEENQNREGGRHL